MSDQSDPDQYGYDDPRRYAAKRARREEAERLAAGGAPTGGVPDGRKHAGGGGAVVSKRSGIGASLKRHGRQARDAAAGPETRYYRDQYGNVYQAGGSASSGSGGSRWRARLERKRAQRSLSGRPGHRGRNIAITILAVLVGLYLVICLPIDRRIAFSSDEAQGLSAELAPHIPGMPYYVLALGSDAREGDTVSRTDTMILCRVDPVMGRLTMVSIPRDTMVEIEGHGTQKINAAYAFGGAAGAVHAVHELTGADISHVAVVHFDGIEALVDALGGVTVDVPVDINDPGYTGLVMSAGTYEMDGHTAMLFSRVRHGFANGDYQRQADQRILIEAIMKKALASPLSLPAVGNSMGDLMSTSLHCYNLIPLVARFSIGSPTVYSASLPSTTQMVGGVSYVVADQQATAQLMQVVNAGGDPQSVANGQQ